MVAFQRYYECENQVFARVKDLSHRESYDNPLHLTTSSLYYHGVSFGEFRDEYLFPNWHIPTLICAYYAPTITELDIFDRLDSQTHWERDGSTKISKHLPTTS